MTCSVSNCTSPILRHGFCNKHMLRWKRHGDPTAGGRERVLNMSERKDNMPEYRAWDHMIYRCTSVNCREYPRYGGRGIKVCDRWLKSFDDFLSDVGPRPSSSHSLDRVNNDGDYEPSNCRWATKREQANNKRNTRKVVYGGREVTIAELSEASGLKHSTIFMRIRRYGWPVERAVSTPAGRAHL